MNKFFKGEELQTTVAQKVDEGKMNEAAEVLGTAYAEIQERILEEARALDGRLDELTMASRGLRTLTKEETAFYQKMIDGAKMTGGIQKGETVLPKSVENRVFEDLQKERPLLSLIKFTHATALTDLIVHKGSRQLATWGKWNSGVTKELSGEFTVIATGKNKLTAKFPLSLSMLDLGVAWIDKYVRTILANAIADALEEAVVSGNGVDCPVGMTRNLEGAFNAGTGYPEKDVVACTSFNPSAYGKLLEKLVINGDNGARKIGKVALICNPADYFGKVLAATTLTAQTGYIQNLLPYPTEIIQSEAVPVGKAVLGIPSRYYLGVSGAADGALSYSDDERFSEDIRVYKHKAYADGRPLDNNAFILLNIANLKALDASVGK